MWKCQTRILVMHAYLIPRIMTHIMTLMDYFYVATSDVYPLDRSRGLQLIIRLNFYL